MLSGPSWRSLFGELETMPQSRDEKRAARPQKLADEENLPFLAKIHGPCAIWFFVHDVRLTPIDGFWRFYE